MAVAAVSPPRHRFRYREVPMPPVLAVGFGLVVEVSKLRVAVRALIALPGLGVGLQAETRPVQQPDDGVRREDGIACPTFVRSVQREQLLQQPGIHLGYPLASPTGQTRTAQRRFTCIQIVDSPQGGVLRGSRCPAHHLDPAMPNTRTSTPSTNNAAAHPDAATPGSSASSLATSPNGTTSGLMTPHSLTFFAGRQKPGPTDSKMWIQQIPVSHESF